MAGQWVAVAGWDCLGAGWPIAGLGCWGSVMIFVPGHAWGYLFVSSLGSLSLHTENNRLVVAGVAWVLDYFFWVVSEGRGAGRDRSIGCSHGVSECGRSGSLRRRSSGLSKKLPGLPGVRRAIRMSPPPPPIRMSPPPPPGLPGVR
jgi:hypothetical protein